MHFETCTFPEKLKDELLLEERIRENKEVQPKDYEDVENIYRQLKYNFDEKKYFQRE